MFRKDLDETDMDAYKTKLNKMRSSKLKFNVTLQSVYPNVHLNGTWVKASTVIAEIMDCATVGGGGLQAILTHCGSIKLRDYTIPVEYEQCIYIMEAVHGRPITVAQVEMDSVRDEDGNPLVERPSYKNYWFTMRFDDDDNTYTATIGNGGTIKDIREWGGGSPPTNGVTLYEFNIRRYWIFKPDYDSDYYGIVNQSGGNII